MNNKIENPKVSVTEGLIMNDEDYLTTILSIEKNMSVNLTIALNESSNEFLYDRLFNMFETIKELQRDIYEIMFQYGWYSLEKAEETKISEETEKFKAKINYIENQD